ncbi:hypothetical protein J7E24_13665 [Hymenobacter sp. ISL-91]|uniref:hypothetical protein n=1 Tax=Hymenobacter sp. ISL-91 TaxID=2819151 RepID=UPI001BE777C5|nr:hypothetical protein [Hymenobacter sp. ISL-91]MBT2558840.1 hypothetical protein [Hymenobacter sp. ISL-91]
MPLLIKVTFAFCLLFASTSELARAQAPIVSDYVANMNSNKKWGWFLDEASTRRKYISGTGFKFISEDQKDNFRYVRFLDNINSTGLVLIFIDGTFYGITYMYLANKLGVESWANAYQKVAVDAWEDRINNARITRTYSGEFIHYRVECDFDMIKEKM